MEGGVLPWKKQAILNNSPNVDDYGKPLPPPPIGFYWNRLSDGRWELLHYDDKIAEPSEICTFQTILEHVVMPNDTIQGICLRYGVSQVSLRQYNNFSGNAFRSRKTLKIPLQPGQPIHVQLNSEEILIQRFKNETGESTEEAKFYLNEHKGNLESALQDWRKDDEWVGKQLPLAIPCAAISATHPAQQSVTPNEDKRRQPASGIAPMSVEQAQGPGHVQGSKENTAPIDISSLHKRAIAPFALITDMLSSDSRRSKLMVAEEGSMEPMLSG